MATTNAADPSTGDDLHLQHQPAPAPAPAADDPGTDKISQEEEATTAIPAPSSGPPAVLSQLDEVAATVEAVPPTAEVELEAPVPEPETVPICDVVQPAETPEPASLEAAPALQVADTEPGPVELLPEEKPALEGVVVELVGTEPEEKPGSVSALTESDGKLDQVAVVEGEVKEVAAAEAAPPEKAELEVEVKDSPLPEPKQAAPENAEQVVAGEEREIDPVPSSEATDEPAEVLKDLPVVDSEPEKKEEPKVVAELQVEEKVLPGSVDEVTDGAQEVSSESAVSAEEVAETAPIKDAAEDNEVVDQIAAAQESAVVDPCEPEVEPATNGKEAEAEEALIETVVLDAEKAVVEEINTAAPDAAEGLPEVEAEKMEQEKDFKVEGGVEETIAKPEELVSGGTENGTNEVEEKLKVESLQEDEIKQVVEDAKPEELTEEKIEKLEESVSSGTENGSNVVEEKLKDESVPGEGAEDVKPDEVTEEKIENPEELVSNGAENGTSVVEEKLKDQSLLIEEHQIADNVKVEEVQQSIQSISSNAEDVILVKDIPDEPNLGAAKEDPNKDEPESNGSELETKVLECTPGDVANESETVKEAAKPDDPSSAVEPPKADDTVSSSRDLPATEVVVTKSTPKSSGNIISKVKQSIVKVKKAIIGKSPAKAEERAK